MKIYVSERWFVVQTKNNDIHLLSWNALGYHLKHIMGLELEQRQEIKRTLENKGFIELEVAS